MTREQWLQNPANIAGLRKILDDPAYQLALSVLMSENMRRIRSIGASAERNLNTDAAQFNEQAGFYRFFDELDRLATVPALRETERKADYKQPSPFDQLAENDELIKQEQELYQQTIQT